jgi:DNA polymerase V
VSALLSVAPVAVACGFPSPAQDYYDGPIDLTNMLVEDQAATFIVRAAGHSMTGAGISDGDELLVDRSKRPQHGDIIVAVLDGELTGTWNTGLGGAGEDMPRKPGT